MEGQAALKENINKLGLEVAGLKPLVEGMHGYMPRITRALEELARITEQLKSNAADHERIHFRVTAVEEDIQEVKDELKGLATATATNQGRLEERFNGLREEHLECITAKRVIKIERRKGFWPKVRTAIEEKAVSIVVWILVSFVVMVIVIGLMGALVIHHVKSYSIIEIVEMLKKN